VARVRESYQALLKQALDDQVELSHELVLFNHDSSLLQRVEEEDDDEVGINVALHHVSEELQLAQAARLVEDCNPVVLKFTDSIELGVVHYHGDILQRELMIDPRNEFVLENFLDSLRRLDDVHDISRPVLAVLGILGVEVHQGFDGHREEGFIGEVDEELIGIVRQGKLSNHVVLGAEVDLRLPSLVLVHGLTNHREAEVQGRFVNIIELGVCADVALVLARGDVVKEIVADSLHSVKRYLRLRIIKQGGRNQRVHCNGRFVLVTGVELVG